MLIFYIVVGLPRLYLCVGLVGLQKVTAELWRTISFLLHIVYSNGQNPSVVWAKFSHDIYTQFLARKYIRKNTESRVCAEDKRFRTRTSDPNPRDESQTMYTFCREQTEQMQRAPSHSVVSPSPVPDANADSVVVCQWSASN